MLTNPWPQGLTNDVDTVDGPKLASVGAQLARALDMTGGGTYAPPSFVDILSAAGGGLRNIDFVGYAQAMLGGVLRVAIGGFLELVPSPNPIPDANGQVIDPAAGIVQFFAPPSAQRDYDLVAAGHRGRLVILVRPGAGNNPIIIHRPASAGAIVTLAANTWAAAAVIDTGIVWRLLLTTAAGNPGADAF